VIFVYRALSSTVVAGQLKAIECALAGARRFQITGFREHRDERIVAQRVVIVQVFVAKREAADPLPHQRRHGMRHARRIPMIGGAPGELAQQIRRPIRLAEQHRAAIRGQRPAVKARDHLATRHPLKRQRSGHALCLQNTLLRGVR